jgi:hypothetical protein
VPVGSRLSWPGPQSAGSDRGDQPLMAFAGQLPAGGPEQRLTHMQRDGTPARESNSAPASADAAGSRVADHLGHGDLRKAGVMTGYHTRWICRREQPQDPERIAICEALAFGRPSMTSLARWASASPACRTGYVYMAASR